MIRRASLCIALVSLLGLSLAVDAQGRRPSSPGNQGRAPGGPSTTRPSTTRPSDFGRSSMEARRAEAAARRAEAEARRGQAETRRAEAEQRRLEAQRRREEAAANNQSATARVDHPPNENAAAEAFLAEQNAENQDLRDERAELREENRGERGPE